MYSIGSPNQLNRRRIICMKKSFDVTQVDILEQHPWPTNSIIGCTDYSSTKWGTLIIYKDPTRLTGIGFHFDQTISPSEEQVNNRWAGRFKYNKEMFSND